MKKLPEMKSWLHCHIACNSYVEHTPLVFI